MCFASQHPPVLGATHVSNPYKNKKYIQIIVRPFKADCAGQFNGTVQEDGHCSGWRGLWFDYNVEMNYYQPAKAGHPELIGSLTKSFTQPEALQALLQNGLTMAYVDSWRDPSPSHRTLCLGYNPYHA